MNNTILNIALDYIKRDWMPVPVPFREKNPGFKGWQNFTVTADDAPQYFNGQPQNIGVLLGQPSNGLIDIDVDCPEAIAVISFMKMPETGASFGRASTPLSHYLYTCPDIKKSAKFVDPIMVASKDEAERKKAMLIEIRATQHTIFPGSTHKETGEAIEWVNTGDPAPVDADTLRRRVGGIAAASLLVRYWVTGGRHDKTLALTGGLLRAGWAVHSIENFVHIICDAASDDETSDRLRAVQDTAQKYADGENVTGFPALAEMLGEPIIKSLTKWLGLKSVTQVQRAKTQSSGGGAGEFYVTDQGEMSKWLDEIDAHYAAQEPPEIFIRAEGLCKVIKAHPETVRGVTFKEDHYRAFRLTKGSQVQELLTRDFTWLRPAGKITLDVACPGLIAQAFMGRGHWAIPPLVAIAEAPTIRPDGTILQASGYDRQTGIYAVIPEGFGEIPECPTKDQAYKALQILQQPFAEFPYINENCRSVTLAAVITALVRPSLRSAPLTLFSAAKMGEGKSLQADSVTHIATGRAPAMMSFTKDPDEMRKRIVSLLLTGTATGCLDNINGTIESETLCTVLTEPVFQDRILGASQMVSLPTTVSWMATGNQVRVAGDLTTRTLLSELDSGEEFPEERDGFKLDLRQWIPAHRFELVRAALTIVRAFWAANCPDVGVTTWGRFEEWSRMVREPLVWLGMADPVESVKLVQGEDPHREDLIELLTAWLAVFGDEQKTVKEVLKALKLTADPAAEHLKEILRERFRAEGAQDINSRRVTGYLRQHQNRVESGLCIKKISGHASTMRWYIKHVAG